MSLTEIEHAITKLKSDELSSLLQWLDEYREELWDKRIEKDFKDGKLNALIQQADKEFDGGQCKEL